ncbi:MAG: hypothetical protein HQ536_04945 [Parcubacteria group bacterium]|nr:hypothetical protein [Parcubacteria group bacterium]
MSAKWDQCVHCSGRSKCSCGSCRIYLGNGYDKWTDGTCTVCDGEGGRYIDRETGHPEDSYGYGNNSGGGRRR